MAQIRLRLVCLSLLSLFLVAIPRARAADFPPISDEDLHFKGVPGHPGAPAAILFREEIDDDRDNHDHMTYMRMKVLTEAGRKYADVTLHFEKTWSDISDVRGRTVHADGTVVPFDGKVLDKEVVKGFGLREHVKSFSLPDVQVGSIIEYRYHFRYRDNTVAAPLWVIQNELWQKKVHFKFIPSPRDIVLNHGQIGHGVAWSTFGPKDLQPKDVEMPNNLGYIELSASDIPPYVKEPHMLDTLKFKYYARFFYRTASKPEQYWKQQGGFWSHDVEKFMGKKDGIADKVNEIVAASDTPEQKVKKIYAFIAGLENQTYLPSRTSQEIKTLGLKDGGVADILAQKSGDRDDLTLLFIAMVRAAGIQAYPMIITSRDDNFFEPYYMSMDQLDTQIAIVTLDGKDVFLDPGTKFCPYGMLPWQYTATEGIRETDHGTEIAQTPEPDYKNAITERIAKLSLDDNGAISGPLKVEYLGEDAMLHRQNALRTDTEGRKKDLEDEVKAWLPAGGEVKLLQEPDWNATSNEFMAVFHISTPVAASAGKRVLLPAHVFQINEKPMFTAATRVNGIYLYYPSREVDQVSITLPSDLEVETLPQPDTERLQRYALYKSEWIQDLKQPKTITVVRDLANADYAFPVTDYPTLKDFYDKVKSGDEQQAILKVNANAAGK
jgi:transglutaminase-like putative cysteine protease